MGCFILSSKMALCLSVCHWALRIWWKGVVSEAQVDSFNLPFYAASPEEMAEIVERNGFFNVERMELNDPAAWLKRRINIPEWVVHVRAAMEESFRQHFGGEVLDEFFDRLTKKLSKFSDELELKYREKTLLLVVLKRQWVRGRYNGGILQHCRHFTDRKSVV